MIQLLRGWAELLDSRFRIPGTPIRFGIDPILSLVPGLGDLASPVFAVLLLVQGVRQQVPKVVLLRMVLNALVDALIGAIPVAGTIGDIFFRANLMNLRLLERHARPARPPAAADYVFIAAVALVFGMLIAVPVALGLYLAVVAWHWMVS